MIIADFACGEDIISKVETKMAIFKLFELCCITVLSLFVPLE